MPYLISGGRRRTRSALKTKNIRLSDRRTSVKLEPCFWDALSLISKKEGMSVHEICRLINERADGHSLTGAIRVFLLSYGWGRTIEEALEVIPDGRLTG